MKRKKTLIALFGLALALMLTAMPALGADFYLQAEAYTLTMPGGEVVPMWGFVEYDSTFTIPVGTATSPGPSLEVPVGDTDLTIHLKNELPEATSIVVHGLKASPAMAPTMFTDADSRQRVRSFTHETAAAATGIYAYVDVTPGTYLYQSGTHIAKQVPMGLYGVITQNFEIGTAYDNLATAFDAEALLIFSEVDPVMNAATDAGTFTSPVNYHPKYFLINGDASLTVGTLPKVDGETLLVRMVNASLKTRSPVLKDYYMTVHAEDGNLYPFAKTRYQLTLPAGKTIDATVAPGTMGALKIADRRGFVSFNASPTIGPLAAPCLTANAVEANSASERVATAGTTASPTPSLSSLAAAEGEDSGSMCFIGALSIH